MYWLSLSQDAKPHSLKERAYIESLVGRQLKPYEVIHHHYTGEIVVCPTPWYHTYLHCEIKRKGYGPA